MIGRILELARARLDRRRVLAVVGGSSLALALGVVFLPGLFPAATFRPASRVVGTPLVVAAFGAAALLLAGAALRETATDSGDDAWRPEAWLPDRSPERAHYDEVRTAGLAVDRALDADDADDPVTRRRNARNRIREVAVAAIAADENCERVAAIERIDDGSWTDDPRAAAFLGGHALAPLRIRIRDWASGERFERWASHAVAEIESRAAVEIRATVEARTDAETATGGETATDDETATGGDTPASGETPTFGDTRTDGATATDAEKSAAVTREGRR